MLQDRLSAINPVKGIADRSRRIGFYTSIAALVINNIQFVNYVNAGQFGPELIINNLVYNLIALVIAFCSYTNFYFKLSFKVGVVVILAHIWFNAMNNAVADKASIIDLPVLMFCPFLLVTFAGYRTLALTGFLQSALLYYYVGQLGPLSFAKTWSTSHITGFTATLVTMSLLCMLSLAAVAHARQRMDKKLLALIREKEALAAEDPLTGLDNRRSFLSKLNGYIEQNRPLGCAFIDLDRFKPINDKYGHAVGDHVIKTIGERLLMTPGVLCVARLGGDEFGILVNRDQIDAPMTELFDGVYERICQEIITDRGNVGVGASIGYSVYPTDGTDVTELMHAADIAMRRTKSEKVGAVRFNRRIDSSRLARAAMEMGFKDALQKGDMKPALQPIACSQTGRILGYEMLARWVTDKFPERPSPVDFIPIAERFGLLNELLMSTLSQALEKRDSDSDKFLAINVSPSQLSHPKFLSQIRGKLEEYNMDPALIELEVTEQVAFRNVEHNIKMLREAREMGMKIALDDFGTGYSSLSILDALPLDKLKIDRSFLHSEYSQNSNSDVLSATINLARRLNLSSCIEGVEDEETAKRVIDMGCDQIQGYWIGHPTLVAELRPTTANLIKQIA